MTQDDEQKREVDIDEVQCNLLRKHDRVYGDFQFLCEVFQETVKQIGYNPGSVKCHIKRRGDGFHVQALALGFSLLNGVLRALLKLTVSKIHHTESKKIKNIS